MTDLYRNPQDGPARPELNEAPQSDTGDWPFEIAGPGGKVTNIENNERGILDTIVFRTMGRHKVAELSTSMHDPHAQGVYKDSGEKYGD